MLRSANIDVDHRSVASQLRVRYDSNNTARIYFRMGSRILENSSVSSSTLVQEFPVNNTITAIDTNERGKIKFYVDSKQFSSQIINTTLSRPRDYQWTRNALFPEHTHNIVVEFSSPNIAKPFHIGHFRSTIIGNFVANICEKSGNSVTRLNYLGDWGTQFGLLLSGLEVTEGFTSIEDLTLSDLLEVYIKANKLSSSDPEFAASAQRSFRELENGDEVKEKLWKYCRDVTIEELRKNYDKLNVKFDHYHGESQYRVGRTAEVLDLLNKNGLLKVTDDGRTVIALEHSNVTVQKSDGSSLYISRDIAAALDRKDKFNFDKMYYVVDNSQGHHFLNLFEILSLIGCDWSGDCSHVKFGKIKGMSTRAGNIVLMSDIIEEAAERMRVNQERSANTRVEGEEAVRAAEIVGISALIINDLQQRRSKDYQFSWERALSDAGDTGVKLQYTHARLCSLIDKCGDLVTSHSCGDHLQESVAVELTVLIAKYDEMLSQSYQSLEAVFLVKYLFQLCNTTSKALKLLPVINAETEEAGAARLRMFQAARVVLADAMTVMGITPLERI